MGGCGGFHAEARIPPPKQVGAPGIDSKIRIHRMYASPHRVPFRVLCVRISHFSHVVNLKSLKCIDGAQTPSPQL